MTDRNLFCEAGRALYGALWQAEMARALGVSDRTVLRWASGEAPIPAGVWQEIPNLIIDRSNELADLLDRIRKRYPPTSASSERR